MPLIVSVVQVTGLPPAVRLARVPAEVEAGIIPRRPFDPAAAVTVKARALPLQAIEPKEEPLRPSSQVSICFAVTAGTPLARASLLHTTLSWTEACKSGLLFSRSVTSGGL